MNIIEKGWIKLIKCFIVPCEKATYLETKSKFEELDFKERLNLNMHMMKCSYCRVFRSEQEFIASCLTKFKNDIESDNLYFKLPEDTRNQLEQIIADDKNKAV